MLFLQYQAEPRVGSRNVAGGRDLERRPCPEEAVGLEISGRSAPGPQGLQWPQRQLPTSYPKWVPCSYSFVFPGGVK